MAIKKYTRLLPMIICAAVVAAAAQTSPQPPCVDVYDWKSATSEELRGRVSAVLEDKNFSDECFRRLVASLHSIDGGRIPLADTLYRALDAAGRLEAHDLLRYGRVKSLLGDYRAAASVYCRVIAADRRLEHAALTQAAQFLGDAEPDDKKRAMTDFEKCVFALESIDTAHYRNWIANFYRRGELYDMEIGVLLRYNIVSAPSGRQLAEAARTHYMKRRYRHAASAAVAAHGGLEGTEQSAAAFVAYQSYIQLGVRDSALAWLRESGVANMDALIQAAALSQDVGHIDDAGAFIDSLPIGLPKDTLTVRQHIFTGNFGKAFDHIGSRRTSWTMNPRERMLWQARTLIFSGRPQDAQLLLDSIRFAAGWHATSETLNYKYYLQKLDGDQRALGAWGALERRIFTGDLTTAAAELARQQLSGVWGEMLVIRLGRRLALAGRHQEALEVLELISGGGSGTGGVDFGIKGIPGREPAKRSAEYLYLTAEMLRETGRGDDARALARRILKEFPGDIFAQKARILLTRI